MRGGDVSEGSGGTRAGSRAGLAGTPEQRGPCTLARHAAPKQSRHLVNRFLQRLVLDGGVPVVV